MSNSIEWAHVDDGAELITAADLFTTDPEDHRLELNLDDWNTAIFAGDAVAIYANSPEELKRWLLDQINAVDAIIATATRLAPHRVYMLTTRHPVADSSPTYESFTDRSKATWAYLAAIREDHTHSALQVELLMIDGTTTITLASTDPNKEPE